MVWCVFPEVTGGQVANTHWKRKGLVDGVNGAFGGVESYFVVDGQETRYFGKNGIFQGKLQHRVGVEPRDSPTVLIGRSQIANVVDGDTDPEVSQHSELGRAVDVWNLLRNFHTPFGVVGLEASDGESGSRNRTTVFSADYDGSVRQKDSRRVLDIVNLEVFIEIDGDV